MMSSYKINLNNLTKEEVLTKFEERLKIYSEDDYIINDFINEGKYCFNPSLEKKKGKGAVSLFGGFFLSMADDDVEVDCLFKINSETREELTEEQKEKIKYIEENYEVFYYCDDGDMMHLLLFVEDHIRAFTWLTHEDMEYLTEHLLEEPEEEESLEGILEELFD